MTLEQYLLLCLLLQLLRLSVLLLKTTDFYNKNHFDYRGLIEMGLALEAPEGMYKFNNYEHIR